jgi:hypothetical protein
MELSKVNYYFTILATRGILKNLYLKVFEVRLTGIEVDFSLIFSDIYVLKQLMGLLALYSQINNFLFVKK